MSITESKQICKDCRGNGYIATAEQLTTEDSLPLCRECNGNGYIEPRITELGRLTWILNKLEEIICGKTTTKH